MSLSEKQRSCAVCVFVRLASNTCCKIKGGLAKRKNAETIKSTMYMIWREARKRKNNGATCLSGCAPRVVGSYFGCWPWSKVMFRCSSPHPFQQKQNAKRFPTSFEAEEDLVFMRCSLVICLLGSTASLRQPPHRKSTNSPKVNKNQGMEPTS